MIKEQIKAIFKQYADKGKKMYRETVDSKGSLYNAGFWDGYECCAKGLLRELEDMQEEPTIPDIVDEHFYEMLGEESVSEGIIEAAEKYANQQLDNYDNNGWAKGKTDQFFDSLDLRKAYEAGANWQKQQTEKSAIYGFVAGRVKDEVFVASRWFKDEKLKPAEDIKLIIIKS